MAVSVVLATYNQPELLEKVLWGYAVQTRRDFQLVVADDGSGPATRAAIERFSAESRVPVVHVWHEDAGFRKCEILNRAITASDGDYLVFSDGDCIPGRDFVATHLALARPRCFLSGGYLKLSAATSGSITLDDVRAGRATDARWLGTHGWRPGRRALRLARSRMLATALDRLTPTRPTWNGHNASTWREALLAVNGFDAEMKYGGEDRALGERLVHLGYRGVQIRHRAPVVHLDHGRPYIDRAALTRNREIRDRIARHREARARNGIDGLDPQELDPQETVRQVIESTRNGASA